ncbi:MAG: agmatine deiminase family protein [Tabrizicola sp.]
MARSREALRSAGLEIIDFPYMSGFMDEGNWIIAPYMNFYFCNGGVIVPVAGEEPDKDEAALALLSRLVPDRQVVGVTLRAGPRQGGAIHCMTMQVPVRP